MDVAGFKISTFESFAINRHAWLIVDTFTGLLGNHAFTYCNDVVIACVFTGVSMLCKQGLVMLLGGKSITSDVLSINLVILRRLFYNHLVI